MGFYGIFFLLLLLASVYYLYSSKNRRQLEFIQSYRFYSTIGKKIQEKYPHLRDEDVTLVLSALKDYFYICNKAKRRMVSMPSQVVDVAWHEFILFTRPYQTFCDKALGRFLHHTPTEAMRTRTLAQDGIKRAWRLACAKDNISANAPIHLPLLFAIDAKLGIKDGFIYSLNCKDESSPLYGDGYCAGHIGCASGCAGDSGATSSSGGFFDSFGGDSSDCGGGCGGD
ncbi:MAG: hypothetical protein KBT77_11305 [Thalassolituus oleivorans]|nr:hypothetical protein [Thalassolituus oleivorans]MBQ0727923.1 hypothetical protein [Thalassolituus oleivorans]MBQ0781610.1 hypothetical protein [Thalassolituus oleivorans]